jgi:hypothetical protein
MIEILICNNCTASVSTEQDLCQYCGNDFRTSGESAEILDFVELIDRSFAKATPSDLIEKIKQSKFKDHPMVRFRKAKILLIEYMTNDSVLDYTEFIEILKIIKEVSEINNHYWFDFSLYLTVLLPSSHTKLYIEDYQKIKSYIDNNNLDNEQIIDTSLKEQLIISTLGEQFFKEYKFYQNPSNYINNNDFIQKKDFLIAKYEKFKNSIQNQINNLN